MSTASAPASPGPRVAGRISVVVPALNQQDFIGDTLASLARQRLEGRELEVLVIDDASTDATARIAGEFAGRLPGLEIITHPVNRGVSAARNTGLERATGEFISFLDPDDWLAPTQLGLLAGGIERLDVDFVRCDHVRVTGGNRELYRAPQANREVALVPADDISPLERATMIDYPYSWAGMYRARLLEAVAPRFNESLRTAEDRPWFWKLGLGAASYAVLNAPGIFYRRGLPGSLTQVFDDRQLDFLGAFADIFELVLGDPAHAPHAPKALRQFLAVSCHHLSRSSAFPPVLRRRLRAGVAERLAGLPEALLAEGIAVLDSGRTRMLSGLLPAARPRTGAPATTPHGTGTTEGTK